jgi:mannosyltransferase OCH1-like enzyme
MNRDYHHKNPKIIHRIYFTNFAPFHDPYEHYLDTWHKQMPDYKIMHWNMGNLDVYENAWTTKAFERGAPVFLSEYFRWKILYEFGGLYLDADCEIINGTTLSGLIDELYNQDQYDVFFGVEERENGHPTAQTCGAKKGSDLAFYMMSMYRDTLAPLWSWREKRGLIGPQLMSLYFLDRNENVADDGFFKNIEKPVVLSRAKVYPQVYFSPKFSLMGEVLEFDADKTCVYHLFANSNLDFSKRKKEQEVRACALKFDEYQKALEARARFPRYYDASHFHTQVGQPYDDGIASKGQNGIILFGPYISLPQGEYVAKVGCRKRPLCGGAKFSVTADRGVATLASKYIKFDTKYDAELELAFYVQSDVSNHIEFVLSIDGIDAIDIVGVTVSCGEVLSKRAQGSNNLKILHRVYFGFDGKPDQFEKYLETWREQLPEFEIMRWDASNLPMDINAYVRKLYEEKDHAFLTDFFRWYLLREYGGTYLDADVEVVNGQTYRKLIEELEVSSDFDAFIGIDERGGGWYTAHSMASKQNSDLSKFMCDVYANLGSFAVWRKKGMYFWAPQLTALYFANAGHNIGGMGTSPNLASPEVQSRVKIYPQDWFSPLSPTGNSTKPFALNGYSDNTSLCHHFACSWHESDSIYLEHSRKRGGQANVLLSDLVHAAGNGDFSAGSDAIQTQVGVKRGNTIVTQGFDGCLAHGPYTALLAGEYLVTFSFQNVRSMADARIDVTANFGQTVLVARSVRLSDLRNEIATLGFTIDKVCDAVEFRVHVGVQSAFELTGIRFEQLDICE